MYIFNKIDHFYPKSIFCVKMPFFGHKFLFSIYKASLSFKNDPHSALKCPTVWTNVSKTQFYTFQVVFEQNGSQASQSPALNQNCSLFRFEILLCLIRIIFDHFDTKLSFLIQNQSWSCGEDSWEPFCSKTTWNV